MIDRSEHTAHQRHRPTRVCRNAGRQTWCTDAREGPAHMAYHAVLLIDKKVPTVFANLILVVCASCRAGICSTSLACKGRICVRNDSIENNLQSFTTSRQSGILSL